MRPRYPSLLALLAVLAFATPAAADIYQYTDSDGVVHFTNVKPRKDRRRWKRVMKTAAERARDYGKAAAPRGSCERCDRVPSRDNSPERYTRYDDLILEAAALYQMPVPLIRAVIKVESDYDPRVVSAMNARGLMQLMPDVMTDMGVRDAHDPRENILGGTRLLRILANRYDGDLVLTIAGYHAGMGSMEKYEGQVPPYQNTRKYVRMVLREYYRFRDREKSEARR